MMTLKMQLESVLMGREDALTNANGVEISCLAQEVDVWFVIEKNQQPGDELLMMLIVSSNGLEELISLFNIKAVEDLFTIDEGTLRHLFYEGKATICCQLENHHEQIHFYQKDRQLYAQDFKGRIVQLEKSMSANNDFIQFAKQYPYSL